MSWDGDENGGPWGRNRGPRRSSASDRNQPDFDDLLRKSQDRIRRLIPNLGRSSNLLTWIIVLGVIFWLASGIYRVKEGEQAAVLRFGKLNRITGPGLRYRLPAPFEEQYVVKVSEINVVQSGVEVVSKKLLQGEDAPNLMLTGDENIVKIIFRVQWYIKDIGQFLFNDPQPRETVKVAAESAVREVMAQTKLADALTTGKDKIIQDSKRLLQRMLDDYKIGIQILSVNLIEVNPPDKVRDAFLDVQRARADRERKINEAHAYRNSILPVARGEAKRITQSAEGDKQALIVRAKGEAARFTSVLEAYLAAPEITLIRLRIENAAKVLKGVPKIIINGDKGSQGVLPILLPTLKQMVPAAEKAEKEEQQ
jgi:membrane protease subunit HflK